jgi:hypothetical protein
MRRLVLISAVVALMLASVPATAPATFIPGPAGKVAFTSGRPSVGVPAPNGGDAGARIYVADYPSGTPVQVTTLPEGADVRHRQPNWSPDHTRIVYAAGKTTYALWILDLRTGSQTEFVPPAAGLDRPAWSPDGTRIAYGSEGDLWVKGLAAGSTPINLTESAGVIEERPVWSHDGTTLYYNQGMAGARDIYSFSPVTQAGEPELVETGTGDDWQVALSPDGGRICFLRGPQSSASDLFTYFLDGGSPAAGFATDGPNIGELNCVWAPDGSKVLYTRGAFEAGELYTRSPNGQNPDPIEQWNVAGHFDGNADWATNFSPVCAPVNISIDVNKFTTVQLSCTDPDFGFGKSPPGPIALESSSMEILTPPKNGTIGGLNDGKVIYTPNKDFRGVDSFTYTGSDGTSDADPATVTIQVGQPGAAADRTPPKITNVKVSAKRWRLGNQPAKISAAPIGTTISFRLSEAAQTTLTFQRRKRTKGGKTKFVNAGRIVKQAKAGNNRVRFQGLITRGKKLSLGTHRVVVGARDAAGNRSKRNGPTFTIVKK